MVLDRLPLGRPGWHGSHYGVQTALEAQLSCLSLMTVVIIHYVYLPHRIENALLVTA